ncbi:MAG: hypothetical protein ACTSPX_06870 [Candidatus Thorarchaeota archaeon]
MRNWIAKVATTRDLTSDHLCRNFNVPMAVKRDRKKRRIAFACQADALGRRPRISGAEHIRIRRETKEAAWNKLNALLDSQ